MPITAHLAVDGAAKAIEFYAAAFGAEEVCRMPAEDGKRLMHAELRVAGGKLYLHDDFPEYCGGKVKAASKIGATPVTLHLEVPDCDAAIAKAAAAGAEVTMPAADMFWGDRYGKIVDPFGHEWSFSTPLAKAA
jgi:PhnB protein